MTENGSTRKEVTWTLLVLLIAILHGFLLHSLAEGHSDLFNILNSITLVAVSGTVLSLVVLVMGTTRNTLDRMQGLKQSQHDPVELQKKFAEDRDSLLSLRASISQRRSIVRSTGEQTLDQLLESIRARKDGFEIEGQYWALESYIHFWRSLVQAQEERSNAGDDGLIARITHSNSIDIWKSPQAETLLSLQRSFVNAGGRVLRILLGHQVQPSPDYEEVMADMREYRIDVWYLPIKHNEARFDFLWADKLEAVVKWASAAGGSGLRACEVLDVVEPGLKNEWYHLATRVVSAYKDLDPETRKLLLVEHPSAAVRAKALLNLPSVSLPQSQAAAELPG